MKTAKFVIVDRFKADDPKEDREYHLGVTDDPVEALRLVKQADHFGVIQMHESEPEVRQLDFTAQTHYTRVHRQEPGHRTDSDGSDEWHGFIEYCESYGYGSPVKPRKARKKKVSSKA